MRLLCTKAPDVSTRLGSLGMGLKYGCDRSWHPTVATSSGMDEKYQLNSNLAACETVVIFIVGLSFREEGVRCSPRLRGGLAAFHLALPQGPNN